MRAPTLLAASAAAVALFTSAAAGARLAASAVPCVPLSNAAAADACMPIVGSGSGGYVGNASANAYGSYPECANDCSDPQCVLPDPDGWSSCGGYVQAAQMTWLQLGGRRIDNSDSYHNQRSVGIAMRTFMKMAKVPRSDLWLTSKVGPYLPLGNAEALAQFANILNITGVGYADLLLIHWPSCTSGGGCNTTALSTDPPCVWGAPTYDERQCRLSTWRALVSIWQSGGARAIGVSNYNASQLQEIADAGLPLPAVVQNPFNIGHSASEMETLAYCKAHNITFNGYSPFGVPDHKSYPMYPATMLQDPVALAIAAAHGRTASEVMLAWQWALGIVTNPRTQDASHMLLNLQFMDIELSASEIQQLSLRPQY